MRQIKQRDNPSMTVQKIISIAEGKGWSVHIEEVNKDLTHFEFSQFTPAGQDFSFTAELTDEDPKTLIRSIKEYYDSFDADAEAYVWIGGDGHGKNGAPYHIKDIVNDMETTAEMVYELYLELDKAY